MMKSYFITVVLLLVISKNVVLSIKNEAMTAKDKHVKDKNENLQHFNLDETTIATSTLHKDKVSLDTGIISTTHRPVRINSSLDRDTKLMNLLAARRSALHRDKFRMHRGAVTTGRIKPSFETTTQPSTDLRTICVRNCTTNFTRRTTASCMRRCSNIQRKSDTASTKKTDSEEEKSQKDNNEILFTDESSHGFFVVAKNINDTMNHISDIQKLRQISPGNGYNRMPNKSNSALQVTHVDAFPFLGRKTPSLRPSFLSISTVSNEHPQIFEVSVSQKPPSRKNSRKFYNPRDRNISMFTKRLNTVTKPVVQYDFQESSYSSSVYLENGKEKAASSKDNKTFFEDVTPILLEEDEPNSTESIKINFSTPLLISVLEDEETTTEPEFEQLTETTKVTDDGLKTELPEISSAPQIFEEKDNLVIFANKTMEVATPFSVDTKSSTHNLTEGMTVLQTTILSSIRSTVYPPTSTMNDLEIISSIEDTFPKNPSGSLYKNTETSTPSILEINQETTRFLLEGNGISPDMKRINTVTYVIAGLGMFPILIVFLYLAKSMILKRHFKHNEEFDVCITDQQPISPVKKIEKIDEEIESGHYEQSSISSTDEFNRSNLRLRSLLGEGNFGQVWKAEADDLSGHVGATRIVAVKTVRSGSAQNGLKEEATIMRKLGSHPNVVTLLGACIESEPHILIMEFAMRGRLLSLLRAARSATNILPASVPGGKSLAPLSPRTLAGFALNIATGMEYIAEKRIVHRDLAARNVLIDHNGICKICDFGMSIDLDVIRKKRDKQYHLDVIRNNSKKFEKFRLELGERLLTHWGQGLHSLNIKKRHDPLGRRPALPIRWMAPESLQYNEFSTSTDVWAFGIVLWEIASLGATPYSNLSGREVVRQVIQGTKPELPKDGRNGLFDLMSQCWNKAPELRPTFRQARLEISRSICKWIEDDTAASDYMDISGFSEDLEHGMVYFNQRISEFECEI